MAAEENTTHTPEHANCSIFVRKNLHRSMISQPVSQLSPHRLNHRDPPLLCCEIPTKQLRKDGEFQEFCNAFSKRIGHLPMRQDSPNIDHLVEISGHNTKTNVDCQIRFCVSLNPANDYHECTREIAREFADRKDVVFATQMVVRCEEHSHEYQVLRYNNEQEVCEGVGEMKPAPSPLQVARAKRRAWARKVSHAKREEMDNAIRKISYGNRMGTEVSDDDWELARLSLYLAETRTVS